jgi:hypothetical protein
LPAAKPAKQVNLMLVGCRKAAQGEKEKLIIVLSIFIYRMMEL